MMMLGLGSGRRPNSGKAKLQERGLATKQDSKNPRVTNMSAAKIDITEVDQAFLSTGLQYLKAKREGEGEATARRMEDEAKLASTEQKEGIVET